jgi:hypothetical protein
MTVALFPCGQSRPNSATFSCHRSASGGKSPFFASSLAAKRISLAAEWSIEIDKRMLSKVSNPGFGDQYRAGRLAGQESEHGIAEKRPPQTAGLSVSLGNHKFRGAETSRLVQKVRPTEFESRNVAGLAADNDLLPEYGPYNCKIATMQEIQQIRSVNE